MGFAARVGDFHATPGVSPTGVPFIGGPIILGSPNVLIGNAPAARQGDFLVNSTQPDTITTGSSKVLINGMAAARVGDSTGLGGTITQGLGTVLIG